MFDLFFVNLFPVTKIRLLGATTDFVRGLRSSFTLADHSKIGSIFGAQKIFDFLAFWNRKIRDFPFRKTESFLNRKCDLLLSTPHFVRSYITFYSIMSYHPSVTGGF